MHWLSWSLRLKDRGSSTGKNKVEYQVLPGIFTIEEAIEKQLRSLSLTIRKAT